MVEIRILALMAVMPLLAQEHSYTQNDIDEGARWYRRSCIGCHGGAGDSVAGIDLARGKFRSATSDEDLVKIILNGVPGTAMPTTPIPPVRASMVVAYLRTMNTIAGKKSIAAVTGDPARGRLLFAKPGACAGCHRVNGEGGRSGPDLSEAGHLLRPLEIEMSILEPDEQYPIGTRPVKLVRKSGAPVTGLLLNQDTYSVQVLDQEGSLRSVDRSGLTEVLEATSWMPSYRGKLSAQELADVIAYIGSLRGSQ